MTTVLDRWDDYVSTQPDKIALVGKTRRLSYQAVDRAANTLMAWLVLQNILPEQRVAILLEDPVDVVIAMLGIMKSGGAFIPLDPDYPAERIHQCLQDANPKFIVTSMSSAKNLRISSLPKSYSIEKNIHITPHQDGITHLDELPLPHRSDINYDKYFQHTGHGMVRYSVNLQATRGCPYQCAYCHQIFEKKHVIRSHQHVIAEMERLYRCGVRRYVFIDDIFNLNRENSMEILRTIIARKWTIQLYFPNGLRMDIMTKDYIDLLVEAGMCVIAMPLESASPRIQKFIGKNLNIDRFIENAQYILEKYPHVITNAFGMIGFPTETLEEASETLHLIKSFHWIHFPMIFLLKIYPNTRLFDLALQTGISEEAIYRSANIAYHEIPDTLPFSKQDARELQADFMQNYFLNPERLQSVIPYQVNHFSQTEILQLYNDYLPESTQSINRLAEILNLSPNPWLNAINPETPYRVEAIQQNLFQEYPPIIFNDPQPILLIDLSRFSGWNTGKRLVIQSLDEPLGLMYLASSIHQTFKGTLECTIIKCGVDFETPQALINLISSVKPRLIGISTLSLYKDATLAWASIIKQHFRATPLILGGPYGSSEFDQAILHPYFDLIIRGEAELSFPRILAAYQQSNWQRPDLETLKHINGIVYAEPNKELDTALYPHLYWMDVEPHVEPSAPLNMTPSQLAYIIYTSGSGGHPKGVMIEHTGLVYATEGWEATCKLNSPTTLQLAPCTFDVFIGDMARSLFVGGTLITTTKDTRQNIQSLLNLIHQEQVTFIEGTPMLIFTLFDFAFDNHDDLASVKQVVLGGDKFSTERYLEAQERFPHIEIMNGYGTTEASITSTVYHPKRASSDTPIGSPLNGCHIWILDEQFNPVSNGTEGEIVIGGEGVGRGYLHDDEGHRFIPCPDHLGEKGRLFRTGDRAVSAINGDITLLGRHDSMVKYLGYRIDLHEIETTVTALSTVHEAVVLVEKTDNLQELQLFISPSTLDLDEIRQALRKTLPDYMIPRHIILLDTFPLTEHGKVDRAQLASSIPNNPKQSTHGSFDQSLANLWADTLGLSTFGSADNFFDLGGTSLDVMKLLSRLKREWHLSVGYSEFFQHPTLSDFSEFLLTKSTITPSISLTEPELKISPHGLSKQQLKMFFLGLYDPLSTYYNNPGLLSIEGPFDLSRFEVALNQLVSDSDVLRSSFCLSDCGTPQVNYLNPAPHLTLSISNVDPDQIDIIMQKNILPFDITTWPLFRIHVFRTDGLRYVVFADFHHIIADGSSIAVFTQSIMERYFDRPSHPIKPYSSYIHWQQTYLNSNRYHQDRQFWIENLDHHGLFDRFPSTSEEPLLPKHYDRSDLNLQHKTIEALQHYALRNKLTLYSLLLGLFIQTVSGLTALRKWSIGCTVLGRPDSTFDNSLGMFVNTVPVRVNFEPTEKVPIFFNILQTSLLQAIDHADFPLEDSLPLLKDKATHPLLPFFEILFVFQPDTILNPFATWNTEPLKLTSIPLNNRHAKTPLTILLIPNNSDLDLVFEFDPEKLKPETIKIWGQAFVERCTLLPHEHL